MKTQQRLTTSRTLENRPRRKRKRHEEGARHGTRWGGGTRAGSGRSETRRPITARPTQLGKKHARGSGSGQDGSALIVGTPKMGFLIGSGAPGFESNFAQNPTAPLRHARANRQREERDTETTRPDWVPRGSGGGGA